MLYDHFGYYAPAFAAGIGANIVNLIIIGMLVGRQRRVIPGGLDRADQLRRLDRLRVVVDGRLLGRVVHRRVDTVELVQLALDPARARGAGHAPDRQLDLRDDGAHRETSNVKAAVWTWPAILN